MISEYIMVIFSAIGLGVSILVDLIMQIKYPKQVLRKLKKQTEFRKKLIILRQGL